MELVGAFFIGLASGLVGAISTGGGLISVPGLIFMGSSPVTAVATTRLSALSGGITSFTQYNKSKFVHWEFLPHLVFVAVLAGIIGPQLLLAINEDVVERLIGIVLLTMLPVLLLNKDFGIKTIKTNKKHHLWGTLVLFLIMIYGTMFGAGGGIFVMYALVYFFGLNVTEANATGTGVWVIGTTVALVTYIASGAVDFYLGVPLLIGAVIGGYIGANLAIKKGTTWVKLFLAAVILASAIKLLFL